ncbi:transcription elongation factor GreA [Mycoplasmopsis columbinasalis]|uniref:Transcription elongation factor GreA n=1 Tax=Mycoplasmopsis columbinasalis TaxID=114880 RepID=A0A449BA87_9BACT|nr:transcription elongation factor GreA [Mycoplasmopsis columbinasalis]VEU78088.1 transcription elongation factor GreA [Mycoplasmopsis columbinasalis]
MPNKKNDTILLTQDTFDKYKQEYLNLVQVQRPAIQLELKEARAQGDLSENAEYDAARDKQALIENKILELEAILDKAQIIDQSEVNRDKKAGIGAKVTYLNLSNNKEYVVTIMGSHDSNPFENKISNESPIAKAIMEAEVGEVTEVDVAVKYQIKILNIEY